ncbi:MAG: ADP-glyceromanno-heptose 6-epimerase [PVC group bacterium]|nr:ADP-glyceromanno-heptose 6-epimerase [PVC group bacterium]
MIILTGGAGFIGSCFLQKLNAEGINDILVVDHMGEADKKKNLENKSFSDYVEKDVFLRMVKEDKLPKTTHIIHMGACSSTTLNDADYYFKNTYEYSRILGQWSFDNKVPFLYASSAATYGDGGFGYDDRNENTYRLLPLNMYGYSKHLFDLWILNNGFENKSTGLKFFNVFGPNEYHKGEMMSVVCKKFQEVSEQGCIKLFKSYIEDYANGDQKRDFIYIKDAVEIMYYFFKNPEKGGVFNLGTGKAHSWNELARAMFAALDKEPKIEYIEMPEYLRPKYQYFTEAVMNKTKDAGAPVDFQSLEDSVRDYMVNYLQKGECL